MPFARLLLVSLSGVIQILLFPTFSYSLLAWFMLLPLLWVLEHSRPWKAFCLSLFFGLVSAAGVSYWLYHAVVGYFGLPVWLALPLILSIHLFTAAIYFGFFGLLASLCRERLQSWYALLWVPSLWVLCEFLRGRAPTRDPWMLLGYSQHGNPGLVQIADLTGVYGVSFLIVMINVCLYQVFIHFQGLWKKSGPFRLWLVLGRFSLALLGLLLCWQYGQFRVAAFDGALPRGPECGEKCVRVAVVQGNIPSEFRWKSIFYAKNLEVYLRASRKPLEEPGLDLLVWPENALNFHPDREALFLRMITSSLRPRGVTLVTGAPRMEEDSNGKKQRFYNSVYLIDGTGIRKTYDKIVLVPLSEKKDVWPLSLFRSYGEAPSQFVPGTEHTVFHTSFGDFSAPVCFEMIYPEHVRRFVRNGASFVVNVSNDSWLGPDSAQHQHLVYSVFRAVENRRWIVRATNTGISALVDPTGRIVDRTGLGEAAVLSGMVQPLYGRTLYCERGDWFVGFCLLAGLVGFLEGFRWRRVRRQKREAENHR